MDEIPSSTLQKWNMQDMDLILVLNNQYFNELISHPLRMKPISVYFKQLSHWKHRIPCDIVHSKLPSCPWEKSKQVKEMNKYNLDQK